jgi:hypothetical protein
MGMKYSKFSTQVDTKVLKEIKTHAEESGKSISSIVSEALVEYLHRTRTRPAFLSAMNEVLDRHADLLQRLAK